MKKPSPTARRKLPEPIAIVGMAIRLPGAENLDALWQMLSAGTSVIAPLPDARRPAGFPQDQKFWGGFVADADCFDPGFFGISPREAQTMDPQQRFIMELAWNALEDAGIRPSTLSGSRTGVYMGACHWDYLEMIGRSGAPVDAYAPTGIATSILANRVSYHFDLHGPSVTNDTACSSALVAVAEAVAALRQGTCDVALAGAANLIWSPDHFLAFSKNGMLSKTGNSRAFDARADGYVRGEGAAVLVLKPLSRAVADADAIHAVIRGIGMNHGGRTSALTVTNPQAQADLIHDVLTQAGISPDTLDYVEAHGTGTPVGDPIEVLGLKRALEKLYVQARKKPVAGRTGIGSVKNNVGHLEAAAGLAGIAKIVTSLSHGALPPNAGFERPNPLLKLEGSPIRVIDKLTPWPSRKGRTALTRRAAVSSFGFGGTNAHVVLEGWQDKRKATSVRGQFILPLSARDARGLKARAQALLEFLEKHPGTSLASLAATLQTGREPMPTRLALLAAHMPDVTRLLAAFLEDRPDADLWTGEAVAQPEDKTDWKAFVRKGRLDAIARAYVAGAQVDWQACGKPAPRLHLPGYSFARERHWHKSGPAIATQAPLRLSNHSAIGAPRFALEIEPEHFLLAAHHIDGMRILPGTATLQFVATAAREALGLAAEAPLSLTDIVWLRPAATDGTTLRLDIRFEPDAQGLSFQILTADGLVACRGRCRSGASVEALIAADGPSQIVDPAICYTRLVASGIVHGPALKALHAVVRLGADVVTADLRMPSSASSTERLAVMLDASIQAIAAFAGETRLGIPFAADEVALLAPMQDEMQLRVRHHARGHDLELCLPDGRLAARIRNLATRVTQDATITAETVLARPQWRDAQVTALPHTVPSLVLSGLNVSFAEIAGVRLHRLTMPSAPGDAAGHERLALECLQSVRDALAAQPGKPLRVIALVPLASPAAPMLSALLKTMALEATRLHVRLIESDIADPALLAQALSRELQAEGQSDLRLPADGRRLQRHFEKLPSAPAAPLRKDGVYWLTGGNGALAAKIARHLLQQGARHIVLSGRQEKAGERLPPGTDYVPCDVNSPASVRQALAAITRQHGPVTGIFHCAGTLRDGLAATKQPQALHEVFAPKTEGLVALDEATQDLRLDFLMACSSIAAVHGAVGQVDYAAANAFMDGYLTWRSTQVAAGRRHGSSLSINWPLWADGGMQVDDRTRKAMQQRMGTEPLPDDRALAALDQLLGGSDTQIVIGHGASEKFARFLNEGDLKAILAAPAMEPEAPAAAPVATRPSVLKRVREIFADVLAIAPDTIRADMPFETYGFDSIIAMEMIERLEAWVGASLSKMLFFEKIDLNGIVDHLLDEHASLLAPPVPSIAQSAAPAPAISSPVLPMPAVQTQSRGREIAVIGVGGRYPGADDLDGFWQNLRNGVHSFKPVPHERWPHEEIYFPERSVLGKSTIQTGSFLDDIDKFDPRYFNISQADAVTMSPEVRLLLESAVETFENAGYSRESLLRDFDGDVAVLVGTMSNHYNLYGVQNMLTRGSVASGSYTGTMPNMISYFYGLTGPSLFVDTMCSASLTALDLGVRLLREGQCRMALAGGVNLLLHPYNLISSSQEHFTSNRAEVIRSFGLGADGTILGEGVGTALLKPLKDAERDGDNIQAVIIGTAMANAGQRNGFTVPKPAMQAKAVRDALRDAGVDASTISYIETHGSGTKLGDPIEISALHEVFGRDGHCAIGSVKSNIAHLLGAAGIVGFTKLLLQMQHGELAPSLHSQALNPAIPFDHSPFVVQQTLAAWERPVTASGETLPRRAGLTSIGAGGMNGHMILEEYVAPPDARAARGPHVMVFSATTSRGLAALLDRHLDWLSRNADADAAKMSHTLQVGRTSLRCRVAFVVDDLQGLTSAIRAFRAGGQGAWDYCEDVLAISATDLADVGVDASAMARNWARGHAVDWSLLWAGKPPRRMPLPTYPFEKVRCWYEVHADAPSVLNPEAFRRRLHPLIGRNVSTLQGVSWATEIRMDDLLDYAIRRDGTLQLEPATWLDAALAALGLAGADVNGLAEVSWPGNANITSGEMRLDLRDDLSISIGNSDGQIFTARGLPAVHPLSQSLPPVATSLLDAQAIAELLAGQGVDHGAYARHLEGFGADGAGHFAARVAQAEYVQDAHKANTRFSAETLVGISQLLQLAARQLGAENWADVSLRQMAQLTLVPDASVACEIRARLALEGARLVGNIEIFSPEGTPVASLKGIVASASGVALAATSQGENGETALKQIVADILKFNEADIDSLTGFYALGFDSIRLTLLAERINARFGSKLTPAVFYDAANIRDLAAVVGAPVARRVTAAVAPAPAKQQARIAAPKDDAIAVIGMAARLPGAPDVEAFAELLKQGRQAFTALPLDRYSPAYAARMMQAGLPAQGGFLADVARFDADFFQISPAEAEAMDPQQRLALECVWQAMENAGVTVARLPRDTGMFLGVSGQDYRELMLAQGVAPTGYMATGTSHAMLANRISHLLDVHGPSEALDTACSSSLVAVHRAVQALRAGQCGAAFAGGVNITLALEGFAAAQAAGMLSPTSRCHSFSAQADGYVRGEGVGMVLLKRLADAQRDGDPVLGLLIGTAENHGGRASSLTAPSTSAQADLVVAAMNGVDPASVGLIEAHGTGTALGDPVEVNGLKQAWQRLADQWGMRLAPAATAIGSVKTNIGHLEAAAGIAGLIKLILCLRDGFMAPSLDALPPNPHLELEGSPFRVATRVEPWHGPARRAAISSFGFGGTNAHVVLQSAPETVLPAHRQDEPAVIVLSARDAAGLQRRIVDLLAWCRSQSTGPGTLGAIAASLQLGREAMEHRIAFVAQSLDDLCGKLAAFAAGDRRDGWQGVVKLANPPWMPSAQPLVDVSGMTPQDCASRWIAGENLDWTRTAPPVRLALPGYRFGGRAHWISDTRTVVAAAAATPMAPPTDVLALLDDLITGRKDVAATRKAFERETSQ